MAGMEKVIFQVDEYPPTSIIYGHDRPLCGDEYGGMKVCNVLLIYIVLSYCLLFGVLAPLKATKIRGHCIEH